MFEISRQFVDMSNIAIKGSILDIGGGGEAIISRRFNRQVVAIDKRKDELEETPDLGIKIIMDACNLQFLDHYFDNITCFYSLMYMSEKEIEAFLVEAYRVLKPGGLLWIWDAIIPPSCDDIYVVQLEVKMDETNSIKAGFGVRWNREQSLVSIKNICEKKGFVLENQENSDQVFSLALRSKYS